MAIYHLAVKSVSRSTGRSAVAAVAYRAGVCLENERDGLVHDYTRRGGVEDTFIVAPEGAEWAQDRSALWNGSGGGGRSARTPSVARAHELALPAELDAASAATWFVLSRRISATATGWRSMRLSMPPMITATIATTMRMS